MILDLRKEKGKISFIVKRGWDDSPECCVEFDAIENRDYIMGVQIRNLTDSIQIVQ